MTDLSEFEKGMIVGMRCAGISVTETAIYLGRARSTVSAVMTAYNKNRPKETSCFELRVGIRKPLVTARHALQRRQWCRTHRSGPHNSGNKSSSGRMNRRLFRTTGRVYMWRTPKEAFAPECVVPIVKHGGGSLMGLPWAVCDGTQYHDSSCGSGVPFNNESKIETHTTGPLHTYMIVITAHIESGFVAEVGLKQFVVAVQFLRAQHHSKRRRRLLDVNGSTRNGGCDSNCPLAMSLAMVRTNTEVRSADAACLWTADNEAVGIMRACHTDDLLD
ncbi:transposable element Tcb1 transposase [Trichonephila clavipes]|nr:transposable element Tcb1 transposase [Trichonephila clavipes]